MALTRRKFVTASALAALGGVVGRALGRVDAAAAVATPALRPPATGSSTSRCAHCGSPDHAALDGRCGEAAPARDDVQASARRLAARSQRAAGPAAGRAGS